ncbi:cysteine hydrolase [Bacillus pseudomycoides]|uniref:Cysteine hydrolase n=1 Tax=Bacillus pseudomycoides TaxID=64104 RepID=A0AA91V9N5_9BACI|nr:MULTISPECIES: isochorismatase family protein [Bacillus]PEB51747.1 cysteine hydrolase [Bacillus sp. AFS098217]PED80779.1 cysteine hydrolase [Bacillus pseudomycoides]PEU11936.1 cysteine hydrolase [Bacillus sp. AFS019443]PEU14466.1 cysteine hydrolase [Bacillus sp. AFS014408]PFW60817.1 cysteine hydrolase [Bacillus sp. AFS075034]
MKQALLIIDAQQELIDGNEQEAAVFHKDQLLAAINVAIQKALQSNALIIFVRDTDVASGIGQGFQIHKEITVPPEAVIIDKQATNSFYNTSLQTLLKEKEIGHLIIGGCKTEHCIDTAVRTATVQGFDVTLIQNGHSTTDSTILSAQQIIEHHNKTLHGHYNVDHFSIIRDVEEDLFSPIHDQYRE